MNMNKLIGRMVLTMALAGFYCVGAQAQTRIATVDGKKVTSGYWKTKEARSALQEREKDLSKELDELKIGIKKGQDEYKKLLEDANDQAVSPEERDKRKKAAETKLKSVAQLNDQAAEFLRSAQASLKELEQRMAERIDEKVRTAVSARAKSGGYALVLDTAARGVILYASEDNDLTQTVLSQLNSDAPADSGKSGAQTEEKKEPKK